MIKRGHQVTIVTANFSHFKREFFVKNPKSITQKYVEGIHYIWLPIPRYNSNLIKRLLSMCVFAKRIQWIKKLLTARPDIIIGSTPTPFAALSAYHLAKALNVPFTLEVCDLWPETLVQLGKISKLNPLILWMKWIELYLYRHATSIVTLLPGASTYIKQYIRDKNKIHWISNFVTLNDMISKSDKNTQEEFLFVYAGAHGIANGLHHIIDAATILKAMNENFIKIRLIGDGPLKKSLKKKTQGKKLDNIEFIDSLPKDEIHLHLRNADAFIFILEKASVFSWGISSNKLFDYLSMGKPIIATRHSPFDIIDQINCGITVEPNDPPALANAFIQLGKMPLKERNQLGENGLQYVKKHHQLERIVEKLESHLQGILMEGKHI